MSRRSDCVFLRLSFPTFFSVFSEPLWFIFSPPKELAVLLHEKADQAQALLSETGLDCWLIFVRETGIHPDPGMDLVVGADVVRNSAFLFAVGGQRIAITANFDV